VIADCRGAILRLLTRMTTSCCCPIRDLGCLWSSSGSGEESVRSIGGHTGLRHISGSILSFQAHRDRVRISHGPSQLQRDQIEDESSLTVIGRHRHCITLAKLLLPLPFSPVSRYDYSQVTSVYSDLFVC